MSHTANQTLVIQMCSEAFGNNIFKYDTEQERIAGLLRLMAQVASRKDNIPRDFYFGEIDSAEDAEEADLPSDTPCIASWNGEEWVTYKYGLPNLKTQSSPRMDIDGSLRALTELHSRIPRMPELTGKHVTSPEMARWISNPVVNHYLKSLEKIMPDLLEAAKEYVAFASDQEVSKRLAGTA